MAYYKLVPSFMIKRLYFYCMIGTIGLLKRRLTGFKAFEAKPKRSVLRSIAKLVLGIDEVVS
jgi:hypothetical protein